LPLPDEFLYKTDKFGFDLLGLVDTQVSKCYMDDYIVERFPRHTWKELRRLDIWDVVFIQSYDLKDPQRLLDRCVHSYLRNTAMKKDATSIRIIDKLLKKLY